MTQFFCVTIVLLFVVVNNVASQQMSREEAEKFMADVYACKNDTGASDADIEDMYNRVIPTTKTAKCLNLCVFKKLEVMKDGKFSPEGLNKVMAMDKSGLTGKDGRSLIDSMGDINAECKDITDPDLCEMAAKLRMCLNAAAKKRDFCPNVF